jgi:NADPH2:quinone reductase
VGQIFPAPPAIELVAAAGIPEAYLTAFVNLVVEAGLGSGDRVLVHAGASGVGLAAIQVAKLIGAQVAATTRTREKLSAMEEAGADIVFDTTQTDVETELERRWGANSVAVVLNPIGGTSLAADLRLLATGGRIVCIASMAGPKIELEVPLLMRKRARLIGSTLRARPRDEKARLVARFKAELLPALDAGRLRVHVHSIVPPEQASAAFQALRDNQTTGKVLIQWEHT